MHRPFMMAALTIALMATSTVGAAELYFPSASEWQTIDAEKAGWNGDKLAAAMQFAMSRKSSGVVVLYKGKILAEAYQELKSASARYRRMTRGRGVQGRVIEDVASVQKSVVAFLMGVAQEKKLLTINDPVHQHLGVGWSKATRDQETRITIRHLITMSSGLNEKLEFVAPPGTRWKYNTTAYAQSFRAVQAASGKSANELTREWLTGPIGMTNSRWVERRWAKSSDVAANRYGFATTARDLARFGLLILGNGQWNGRTLLADAKYLSASMSPSQKLNPSYGYLWWLNGQASTVRGVRRVKGPIIPTAPQDLVAAFGALGRKCYVVPSLKLVVARLGDAPDTAGQTAFNIEFWRRLKEAAP